MENQFMTYKGYPLVRKGDDIYFGYMCDPYVVWMQVERKQKDETGISVSQKVRLCQMSTDDTLNPQDRVKKQAERDSLFDALNVALTWLERANKN